MDIFITHYYVHSSLDLDSYLFTPIDPLWAGPDIGRENISKNATLEQLHNANYKLERLT